MRLGAKWQARMRCALRLGVSTSAVTGASKLLGSLMKTLDFDDRNIAWKTIEGLDHLSYFIYDVDETNRTANLLFKFAAHERIALHRHAASYLTVVLQGELRIYRADGTLKEVRPVGSYVKSAGGGEAHTEGGGDQDVIVYFSNFAIDGPVYEILGPDLEVVSTIGLAEFSALYVQQTSIVTTMIPVG